MQTFLPYPNFVETAKCLDYRRLGKQRVEAKQILDALQQGEEIVYNKKTKKYLWGRNINLKLTKDMEIRKTPWYTHPAVQMWKGYEKALMKYHNIIVAEWERRGYKNNMPKYVIQGWIEYPPWMGRKDFHDAHKSKLLQKDYEYYSKFGWIVDDSLEYKWG